MSTMKKLAFALALAFVCAPVYAQAPLSMTGADFTPQTSSPISGTRYGVWVKSSDKLLRFNSAGTSNVIPNAVLTTKGDLIGFTGSAFGRFGAGADGLCLKADSTQTFGLNWGACGGGVTPSLQNIYDASPGFQTNFLTTLNNSFGGFVVKDALVPIASDALLTVQNNAGSKSFKVTGDGSAFGAAVSIGSVNSTQTVGFSIQNTTPATNVQQQYSPMLEFQGRAWSSGPGTSDTQKIALQARTIFAASSTAELVLWQSSAGAAYSEALRITPYTTAGFGTGWNMWAGSLTQPYGIGTDLSHTYLSAGALFASTLDLTATAVYPHSDSTITSGLAANRWSNVYTLGVNSGGSGLSFTAGSNFTFTGPANNTQINFTDGTTTAQFFVGVGTAQFGTVTAGAPVTIVSGNASRVYVDSTGTYPAIDNTYISGSAAHRWSNVYSLSVDAGASDLFLAGNGAVYVKVGGTIRAFYGTGAYVPNTDNTYGLGLAGLRWSTLYVTGVNSGASALTLTSSTTMGAGTGIGAIVDTVNTVAGNLNDRILSIRTAGTEVGFLSAYNQFATGIKLSSTTGSTYLSLDGPVSGFQFVVGGGSFLFADSTNSFYPGADLFVSLGKSGNRYTEMWARRRGGVQQTIPAAATITLSPASGEAIRITLSATAVTTVNGAAGYEGETLNVEIIQDATGGRSISGWSTGVNGFSLQGGSYTPSPAANARDVLSFVWDSVAQQWIEYARRLDAGTTSTTTLQQAYTAMPASAPATVAEDSTRQWIQLNDYGTFASEPTGRYLLALDSSDNIDWYSFGVEQAVMWAQNIGATYPRTGAGAKYFLFDNATAATAGAPQQWGIPLLLQARAWNTTTLTSQSIFMGLQARSNSSAPTDGYLAILGTYNNSVDLASPIAEFHTGQTNFLRSFVASTGSAVALALDTGNALASGDKLVSVRNNTTEKFYVDYNGNLWANGASVTLGASPTINATSGTLSLSATALLWTTGQLTWTESANATTGIQGYLFTGGAHTAQPASTEKSDWDWNLARTVQWSTGALTTQRFMRMRQPTIAFVGASTVTDAATFAIDGAPVAGTNATITNSWALMTSAGASLYRQDSISTAQTQTLVLQNRTAATNGAQQYSPALTLGGSGWSLLSSVTRDVRYVTQAQPTQIASSEPGGDLVHYLVVNNATTGANISSTQAFAVRISGDVTQQSYIELFNKNGSSLFKLGAITAQQALLNAKLSPSSDGLFDLGTTALRWGTLFVGGITGNANSMTIANGVSNSAAAKAFIFNASTTLSTSGAEIATFQTGGTEVGSFRLRANGWGLDVVGQGVLTTGQADGASSVGWTINTTTAWSNATSKLLSIQTNSVEKAFILSSGGASFPLATLSAGGQLYTSGSAPTLAAGTGAGTSPTTSYSGTDAAGVLTVTTGTAPASFNATIVTLTFNSTRSAAPRAVVIQAANANAAALTGTTMVFADSTTFGTTGWALKGGSAALTASTTYTWNVWVVN